MAHEIESMMYVGDAPWHGLGVQLPEAPTTGDAIKAAGLDWLVATKKLQIAETGALVNAYATVRMSDESVLGVVGPGYTPLQNDEAFSFFDPFLEAGAAKLETAGSLRDGKRVWILARIVGGVDEIVPGDVVERFVLLSNSHDGTQAVRVGFTPIRVVCANTLAMAHSSDASRLLRVRHHAKVVNALEQIRDIMQLANQEFAANAEQFRALAAVQINAADLRRYVKRVFNRKIDLVAGQFDDETVAAVAADVEAESGRGDRIVESVTAMFEKGRGNDMPGVRGTLWAAYNAVTEYLAHERGSDAEIRLDKMWFGQSSHLNTRALRVATEMAQAA